MYYCSAIEHTREISGNLWVFLLSYAFFHLSVDPLEWDPFDLGLCLLIIQVWVLWTYQQLVKDALRNSVLYVRLYLRYGALFVGYLINIIPSFLEQDSFEIITVGVWGLQCLHHDSPCFGFKLTLRLLI